MICVHIEITLWVFSCNDFILYVLLLSHVQGKLTNFPMCVTVFYYCIEIPTWANVTEKSMCWCRFGSGGGFLGWSYGTPRQDESRWGGGHVIEQRAREWLRVWVYSLVLTTYSGAKPRVQNYNLFQGQLPSDARTIGSHLRPQWEPSFLHVDPWGKTIS